MNHKLFHGLSWLFFGVVFPALAASFIFAHGFCDGVPMWFFLLGVIWGNLVGCLESDHLYTTDRPEVEPASSPERSWVLVKQVENGHNEWFSFDLNGFPDFSPVSGDALHFATPADAAQALPWVSKWTPEPIHVVEMRHNLADTPSG